MQLSCAHLGPKRLESAIRPDAANVGAAPTRQSVVRVLGRASPPAAALGTAFQRFSPHSRPLDFSDLRLGAGEARPRGRPAVGADQPPLSGMLLVWLAGRLHLSV